MVKIGNPLKPLLAMLPPMPSQPPTHEARRETLLQLTVLIGVAVLVHFQIARLSIASFALAIFALKTIIVIRKLAIPPRLVMMILTISGLGLIIYVYGGWVGQRAGISFLILLTALKFLESQSLRDYYIVCLLLFFLAACSFLFNSSIPNILIVIAYTLATTGILFQLSNPAQVSLKSAVAMSASLIAKALPLAIILFFFFPRIHGDFGFLPSFDQSNISSGLEDSLVAGEMAGAAFNRKLAFRVEFDGNELPERSQMYWRVKTMHIENDFTWEVAPPKREEDKISKAFAKSSNLESGEWRYQILHEKSKEKYLPYLDYISGSNKGRMLADYSMYVDRGVAGAFNYKGSSTASSAASFTIPVDIEKMLQVQSKPNAKIQLLLDQWRDGAADNAEIVKRVYQYFEGNSFEYSLTPPSLEDIDPLGDFLFNTREGYCEHYASAFTIIMRMLEVPSRVVVGYQGGTAVNGGEYIEVRYSDAHAWSEVWVNGVWQRVDPTATISPERINFGMDALIELWDSGLLGSEESGLALSNILNPKGMSKILKDLGDSWKNLGYKWNKWVVNYDFQSQRELLEQLGFKHRNSVLILVSIMFIAALTLLLLYFWQLIPRKVKRNQEQALYLGFTKKFKRFQIEKTDSETPKEFAGRTALLFPDHASEIKLITQTYYQLRYSAPNTEPSVTLSKLKDQIKKFKLKAKTPKS